MIPQFLTPTCTLSPDSLKGLESQSTSKLSESYFHIRIRQMFYSRSKVFFTFNITVVYDTGTLLSILFSVLLTTVLGVTSV